MRTSAPATARSVVSQGRRPILELGNEPRPLGNERVGSGLLFHCRHDLPLLQRHRFVVAYQRPVQGQLQQCCFTTDRREHRLTTDLGTGGDGVNGGARPSALYEELPGSGDDRSPGLARLALAQRRAVGPARLVT
jgi:hypothetical protein